MTCWGICGLLAQSGNSQIYPEYTDYDYNHTDYNDNYTDNYTYYTDPVFPEGEFRCTDGLKSISIYSRCDGEPDCLDSSDESFCSLPSCPTNTFQCKHNGEHVCVDISYKCNGIINCEDATDELASECSAVGHSKDSDECGNQAKFKCRFQNQIVCLSKEHYQCDGNLDCDDWKDEIPTTCDNCDHPGLFKCRDGSQCVKTENVCDERPHCGDGSDESDTWANCKSCQQMGSLPCPGFTDICAIPCDGNVQCPDHWDELLDTCKALDQTCSKEAGFYPCTDGSKCIRKESFCDNFKDCGDGEDESSKHCKDKCESFEGKYALLPCDGNSCIRLEQACSSHTRPLCDDGADMNSSLCNGKCYHEYPGRQDPYRRPCDFEGKCILMTSIHDGSVDCMKATDEEGRPWYVDLDLVHTVLFSVAFVILAWLLHYLISISSHYLDTPDPTTTLPQTPAIISLENLDPGKSPNVGTPSGGPTLAVPRSHAPLFPDHQALVDIDNPKWSWQDVGEELDIEDIFFNFKVKVTSHSFCYFSRLALSQCHLLHHLRRPLRREGIISDCRYGDCRQIECRFFRKSDLATRRLSLYHSTVAQLSLYSNPNL